MVDFDITKQNTEVDRLAIVLMQAWEDAEGEPVNTSYVATFADMARAVLEYQQTKPSDEPLDNDSSID